MLQELRPAIVILVLFSALTGLVYPLAVTGIAKVIFPNQAAGSLIEKQGVIVGSVLIGQNFTGDRYFHGRPSAISSTDATTNVSTATPYDASSSSGSNLGPSSQALIDRVKGDVATLTSTYLVPVPVDLVTTSASGLDPDITPAAAAFQLAGVAKARGLPEKSVQRMIDQATSERTVGLLGERRVNVLALNLALDKGPTN